VYSILIKLIVAASLIELGIDLSRSSDCSSRACWNQLHLASQKVLRIDWRPISIFPKEAERFRISPKR
jgi:hypothetical protein